MTFLICVACLAVLLLILLFGLRLHFNAMTAVIDSLDEVSGSKTSGFMRFAVLILTTLMLFGSFGCFLVLDALIIVIRANKK